jgi:hypothetical protein
MDPLVSSASRTKLLAGAFALTAVLGVIDWLTGYELNFFVFYFMPIAALAWRGEPIAAVSSAVLSALIWALADYEAGAQYSHPLFAIWNTMIRLSSFLLLAWAVHRAGQSLSAERAAREQMETTLSELRVLRGLLSICAECKKIRNDEGVWQPVESFVVEHTDAMFSHGYCPTCAHRAMVEAGLAGPTPGEEPLPRSRPRR